MLAPRETADHIAITHVIREVARAFDEKLHETLLPRCFTADARILYRLRGADLDVSMPSGIATFKHFHDRCFWTQHLVSPNVIELGADMARAVTPVHAIHIQIRDDGTRSQWLIGATYYDELVRTDDGWRIADRSAVCPHVEGDFLDTGVQLFTTLPDY
ncbi:MAG: nuclear transport factor 2 family protein [Gammaproteobacteria bacterium]